MGGNVYQLERHLKERVRQLQEENERLQAEIVQLRRSEAFAKEVARGAVWMLAQELMQSKAGKESHHHV